MRPLRIFQMVTVRWYNACAEYAVRLSAGLAARGHDVTVCGFPDSPPILAARRLGLAVRTDFDLRPGRLDAPAMVIRLADALRRQRIDLINAHRAEDHLFAALARTTLPGARLVRTRGDVRPPRQHGLNRFLYERRTDAHVLAAHFMRERFYAGFRIPADRLVTIPPALDLGAFRRGVPDRAAARASLGFAPEASLVGLVGRWTAAKGLPVAIEAFGRLAAARPGVRFVLAGAPNEISRDMLTEAATAAGIIDRLTLLPHLDDVRPLMRSLDVGVVASVSSEAICRVAMEYLALGVPVVGSALNSIPEMVPDGVAGLIVPPGDAGALADALTRLIDDDAFRHRLAAASPAVADARFDQTRLLDETEALYARLLVAGR